MPILADEPAKKPAFELKDGDRVVFLGNTLIERMQRYGYVEAALTARWPDRNVTFRNLGWSGDTVWAESRGLFDPPAKGYQRMLEHVGELKPTVIFLGYGNVEAFAGEKGLPAFVKQYEKLLDDLEKASEEEVRFVLLGPKSHRVATGMSLTARSVKLDRTAINRSIDLYHEAIAEIAGRRRVPVVDLRRVGDYEVPTVGFVGGGFETHVADVSHDGVVWNELGYRLASRSITSQLGAVGDRLELQIDGKKLTSKTGELSNVETMPERLSFEYRRATGPSPTTTVAVAGIPRGESRSIRIDGTDINLNVLGGPYDSSLHWQHGVEIRKHPDDKAFEALRKAIVEKNRLYFLKWRPQNVTYLTLFRKHEQGNNAAELAEFDELVAAKEAAIAKLRKPVKRTYELIRVEPKK